MASSYDQINKIKDKYNKEISAKNTEISALKEENAKLEQKVKELRKQLFDAGEGKGERGRLEGIIKDQERENKTLENKIKDLDGSKLIKTFRPERQKLIEDIKKLKFSVSMYNALAYKFKDGLDNVIEIAARIKRGYADDMDYFTFVFRDDIVGLLEKMFNAVLHEKKSSASKYLVELANGNYSFPKEYYQRIPKLKDKEVLQNMLYLINLETTGYHGTETRFKHVSIDKETNEKTKIDRFLNLNSEQQLDAIFTLLEFMYDVFTNKDHEINLLNIASNWYTTMDF